MPDPTPRRGESNAHHIGAYLKDVLVHFADQPHADLLGGIEWAKNDLFLRLLPSHGYVKLEGPEGHEHR